MSHESMEKMFLDYLEEKLAAPERLALERALAEDSALKESFLQYQALMRLETHLAQQCEEPHPSFTAQTMARIEMRDEGFLARFGEFLSLNRRSLITSLTTCATLVLVLRLAQSPARQAQPSSSEPQPIVAIPVEAAQPLPTIAVAKGQPTQAEIAGSDIVALERSHMTAKHENIEVLRSLPAVPMNDSRDRKLKALGSSSALVERKAEVDTSNLRGASPALPFKSNKYAQEMAVNSAQGKPSGTLGTNQVAPLVDALAPAIPADQLDFERATTDRTAQWSSGEDYQTIQENALTFTKDDPVSTFSIDVDTASYSNMRRFIRAGALPPPNSVRTEEFINYFDYNYPLQSEQPFTLSYEVGPSPLEPGKILLKLGIKARNVETTSKPWNLVFLLDVSGSMADEMKLDLIKRTLPMLVSKMRDSDRIAIVTYAGHAGVALDSTSGSEQGKILAAIKSLYPGGSTNGSSGIQLAYNIAQRNFIAGGVNRVILATDGDFNVGVISSDDLIRLIEEKRRSGVTLTTLGVGSGNLKDGMMEQLADKGNGNYFYLDSVREARKVLQTDLAANVEVVAKDVKLQIEFNPALVTQYRLIGYDNRRLARQDFNNDRVDAGEIGPGHTVTALYELVLANSGDEPQKVDALRYQQSAPEKGLSVGKNMDSELGFLKIRFKAPNQDQSQLLSFALQAANVKRSVSETSPDFRFSAAVSYFAQLLKHSSQRGPYTLEQIIRLAQQARGLDTNGYRQEFIELVKDAAALEQEEGARFNSLQTTR
ncbi:MAG: VWA domain-containing protein [Oligoflexia bacterium]|nr:VWA domain-containing protein [Oligoflexia bacterium]